MEKETENKRITIIDYLIDSIDIVIVVNILCLVAIAVFVNMASR